jgi:hypothetical protein
VFVRKKQNASGSTSVQVVAKRGGCNKVIKTVGCSSDPEVVKKLEAEGSRFIEGVAPQLSFSFDPVATITAIEKAFTDELSDCVVRSVGGELILGSLFDEIGFGAIPAPLFRQLVLARLLYPTSKLGTTEYILRYTGESIDVNRIYRMLDKLGSHYKGADRADCF